MIAEKEEKENTGEEQIKIERKHWKKVQGRKKNHLTKLRKKRRSTKRQRNIIQTTHWSVREIKMQGKKKGQRHKRTWTNNEQKKKQRKKMRKKKKQHERWKQKKKEKPVYEEQKKKEQQKNWKKRKTTCRRKDSKKNPIKTKNKNGGESFLFFSGLVQAL